MAKIIKKEYTPTTVIKKCPCCKTEAEYDISDLCYKAETDDYFVVCPVCERMIWLVETEVKTIFNDNPDPTRAEEAVSQGRRSEAAK